VTTERLRPGSRSQVSMREASAYRRVLWQLLAASRGGPTRLQLLTLLREHPRNTNQLAVEAGLDYKTVEHHLRILRENGIVAPATEGYGATYVFTPEMWSHLDEFERIASEAPSPARARSTEGTA